MAPNGRSVANKQKDVFICNSEDDVPVPAGDNSVPVHDDAGSFSPFFLPMSQMQRWGGDKQVALHTEWGNIFFDLFYVAAAYNLGNLLREDMSGRGVLYLTSLFFPIMNWWMYRMNFMAVHYIRTVPVLSDPQHHIDMFLFCLSLSIGHILYAYALSEVMYCQRNVKSAQLFPEAFHTCRQLLIISLPPALYTFAATVYTGIQYFTYDNAKQEIESRMLAGESDAFTDGPMDDIAAWLLVGGTIANIVAMSCLIFGRGVVYGRAPDYNPRDYTVPLNIDFAIHRYGEWVMLLLGESVLSLLIVDLSDGLEYYAIFFLRDSDCHSFGISPF